MEESKESGKLKAEARIECDSYELPTLINSEMYIFNKE